MSGGSLRLRLSLAAAALTALALAIAGIGLTLIFDRVLDSRTAEELDVTAKLIAGQVRRGPDGSLALAAEPADPRFAAPYGGLYWQVSGPAGELRSRSLWDKRLSLPSTLPEHGTSLALTGPDGGALIAVARGITIGGPATETPITIAVAMDSRALATSRATFLRLLVPSLAALGLVLALAMSVFVQRALSPFRLLRADLRAVHEGRRASLPSHFPDEVRPLVDDLNRLIGLQERALLKARTQAGNLAHGLKTPLAILSALGRRHGVDTPTLAHEIEEQVLAMNGQVERALVRARVAASGDLRRRACPVAPVVETLVSTLRRLPDADSLNWQVRIPGEIAFPSEEGDLTEMLGNLLDNARKWAHRRIRVFADKHGTDTILTIEDDGPGMSEEAMSRIARGRRWDETKPGSGFGLAISGDIAEETGAQMELARSELGGLRLTITWPMPR